MSRPSRTGLDYFPLDTTILNDIKIRRIKKQFGAEAFLLYISLLCDIYSNGYYIEATDDYLFDQGEKLGIPENSVLEIILACVKIGLFCEEFFMEHRILTSKSIQDRFSLATKKRSVNQIVEYNCDFISAPETPVSVSETPPKQGLSTQSKVKESKVNLQQQQQRACEEPKEEPENLDEEREQWKEALLADEDWQATIVRYAGKGTAVLQHTREAMAVFDDYLRLKFSLDTIRTKKDYSQSFVGWWRYHNFNLKMEELSGGTPKTILQPIYPSNQPERRSKIEELMETGKRATEIAMKIYNSQAV
jgi:hypothetical protein